MPRIPTLTQGQNTRLQVTSPVPIGSTTGARIEGEGLQDFGQNLVKTGQNIAEFDRIKKTTQDRVTLDTVEGQAQAVASKAYFEAGKNSKADGSDMMELYSKNFDENTKGLVDNLDPEMKAAAQNRLAKFKNSKADAIYSEVTSRGVEDLARQQKANLGQVVANVNLDPTSVLDAAKAYESSLSSYGALYSQEVLAKKRTEGLENLGTAAIEGYLSKKDFKGAKQALTTDLAGFFDPEDIQKKFTEINQAELTFTDRTIKEGEKAEKDEKEALDKLKTANGEKLFFALRNENDPAKRNALLDQASDLGRRKLLSVDFMNKLEAEDREVQKEINDVTSYRSMKRLIDGEDPSIIKKDVQKDFANGDISAATAEKLLKQASMRESLVGKGDTIFKQQVKSAESSVDARFEKDFAPGSSLLGKQSRAELKADIQLRMYDLMQKGVKPQVAAKKAIQSYVPMPEALPTIPGFSSVTQNTSKDLQIISDKLRERNKAYSKMSDAEKTQLNDQLKALKARQTSASIHEEVLK